MKGQLGKVAALAALMASGTVQAAPITNTGEVATSQQPQQKQLPPEIRDTKQLVQNEYGGLSNFFIDHGRSPKEYGQYLQITGKQKWTKKAKRRR